MKTHLSKQDLKIIQSFIHLFGFNIKEINDSSTIDIYDDEDNIVGYMFFRDNQAIIQAYKDDTGLNATYQLAKGHKSESNIWFQQNKGKTVISGLLQPLYLDNKLYFCSNVREYSPKNGIVTAKVFQDYNFLNIKQENSNYQEEIAIKPSLGIIYHTITDGEYDIGKESFPYKYYAGIIDNNEASQINLFLREETNRKTNKYKNLKIEMPSITNSKANMIYHSSLMQSLDPYFFFKTQKMKSAFNVGNYNIIDSIIDFNYNNLSERELASIIGQSKPPRKKSYYKVKQ